MKEVVKELERSGVKLSEQDKKGLESSNKRTKTKTNKRLKQKLEDALIERKQKKSMKQKLASSKPIKGLTPMRVPMDAPVVDFGVNEDEQPVQPIIKASKSLQFDPSSLKGFDGPLDFSQFEDGDSSDSGEVQNSGEVQDSGKSGLEEGEDGSQSQAQPAEEEDEPELPYSLPLMSQMNKDELMKTYNITVGKENKSKDFYSKLTTWNGKKFPKDVLKQAILSNKPLPKVGPISPIKKMERQNRGKKPKGKGQMNHLDQLIHNSYMIIMDAKRKLNSLK